MLPPVAEGIEIVIETCPPLSLPLTVIETEGSSPWHCDKSFAVQTIVSVDPSRSGPVCLIAV